MKNTIKALFVAIVAMSVTFAYAQGDTKAPAKKDKMEKKDAKKKPAGKKKAAKTPAADKK